MVEYLINKGAAIANNVFDDDNNTLLMMFINQGSEKIITMLLQMKQMINYELIVNDIYWKIRMEIHHYHYLQHVIVYH